MMRSENRCIYDLFKTRWGWFGILGCDRGLIRTHLPSDRKPEVQHRLLDGFEGAIRDKTAFSALKTDILGYYEGQIADFSQQKVHLAGLSEFRKTVLVALQSVPYGQTATYGELARLSGHPKAARAIGTVMANNPLPLIIPCHRVIKADGNPGQFSAPGGTRTKKRMLELEKS